MDNNYYTQMSILVSIVCKETVAKFPATIYYSEVLLILLSSGNVAKGNVLLIGMNLELCVGALIFVGVAQNIDP